MPPPTTARINAYSAAAAPASSRRSVFSSFFISIAPVFCEKLTGYAADYSRGAIHCARDRHAQRQSGHGNAATDNGEDQSIFGRSSARFVKTKSFQKFLHIEFPYCPESQAIPKTFDKDALQLLLPTHPSPWGNMDSARPKV
jgi:hypothetical protein